MPGMEGAERAGEQAEIERLRTRVEALENELIEVQARANAAVAAAQERAYWLERWHVDLNALMRRPGARELRAALRAIRAMTRALKKCKRRLFRR
jgi:hypothetical protein